MSARTTATIKNREQIGEGFFFFSVDYNIQQHNLNYNKVMMFN